MKKKQTWWKLDHHVWQLLKEYQLQDKKFLVALSGGRDSVVLAEIFYKVLGPEKVAIAHFHHGGENEYRHQALNFCREFSAVRGLKFFEAQWQGIELKSEAQFREKRYEFLLDSASRFGEAIIVTAHHADDVLETRLMRLIRGTGPQGLRAIHIYKKPFFRPLLPCSGTQIKVYLSKQNLKYLTDPSNLDTHYFRNWLRRVWLPQLEKARPGSSESLGRSLELVVEALSGENDEILSGYLGSDLKGTIARSQFLTWTEAQQKRWLAKAILETGQKNFTQFHLEEIRRRVLQSPKANTFKVAGCHWTINAEQISVKLF